MTRLYECEHTSQVYSGYHGAWQCRSCEEFLESDPFDADKLGSVKFGGLYAFKAQREIGMTGSEIGRENREKFKAEKGYDPVSATERWI